MVGFSKRAKRLAFVGLLTILFVSASWTLAAALVEDGIEASATRLALATEEPPVLGTTQETSNPTEVTVPNEPSVPTSVYQVPPPGSHTVADPAPPPPGPADAALPPPEACTNDALRAAAFPRQQFSAERLGGNPRAGKRIALTFDDGPVAGWTEKYLEVLQEKGVLATFFFVGRSAAKEGRLVKEVAAAGHEIGTHSYSHRRLTLLTKSQLEEDFWAAGTVLYQLTQRPIAYFRPPYGATNAAVLKAAKELGQTVVLWNVDPRDWEAPNAPVIVDHVLKHVRPGAIILLHEGKPATYAALSTLIDKLQAKGYEFVTISQLFGFSMPEAEQRVVAQEPMKYGRAGR